MTVSVARRRGRMAGRLLACALCVVGHERAAAQPVELEAVLGGTEDLGPRAQGMGSAFVGLADDANATLSNPAGLATLPRAFDLAFGADSRLRRSASSGEGAGERSRFPSLLGLGLRLRRQVALGFAWSVRAHRILDVPVSVAGGQPGTLPLGLEVRDLSPALAWRIDSRFAVGASANWTALNVAEERHDPGRAAPDSATNFNVRVGVLLTPGPQLRAGLAYQSARRWRLAPEPQFATIGVRAPEVFSFGLSWRADFPNSTRLIILSQSDLSRDRFAPRPAGRRQEAAWRLGAELSFPFGCFAGCGSMWQLRAGLQSQPPSSTAALPIGSALDGEPRRLDWTLGGSLAPGAGRGRLRIDLNTGQVRGRFTLHAGLALRYPRSYRGDLRFRAPAAEPQPAATRRETEVDSEVP